MQEYNEKVLPCGDKLSALASLFEWNAFSVIKIVFKSGHVMVTTAERAAVKMMFNAIGYAKILTNSSVEIANASLFEIICNILFKGYGCFLEMVNE